MKLPTDSEMRVRFHELRVTVAKLEGEIKPLRDKYDKLTQDYHKSIKPLIAQLKKAEEPLFDLKNEMGKICRVLGNQTALQPGDK